MSTTNSAVCSFFLQGNCKLGDRCRKQHSGGTSELQNSAYNNTENKRAKRRGRASKKPVLSSATGSNQRILPIVDAQPSPSSTKLSQYRDVNGRTPYPLWQRGDPDCVQGIRCRFTHDLEAPNTSVDLVHQREVHTPGVQKVIELQRRVEIERLRLLETERTHQNELEIEQASLALEAEERRKEEERQRHEDARCKVDEERQRKIEQRRRKEEQKRQREEEARRRREEVWRRREAEQRKLKEEQRKMEEEHRRREEEAKQRQEEARQRREEERRRCEEQRRCQEEEQRRVDQQRRVTDAQVTMQRVVLAGSIVTFSSGLAIENTITGFESCRVRVKNIPPDACRQEIIALFTQQGLDMSEFHVISVKDTPGKHGKKEADIITNADVAQSLAVGLEGLEFRDERLEFEVGMFNAPGAMGALTSRDENTLTISCRAPSVRYVVEYPDIAFCHTKVRELDGRICAGRRVKVEMNQAPPGRVLPSFRPNSIKINNLPDVVPPSVVADFAQSHSIRALKPHSFDVDSAIRSLQLHINQLEGIEAQSFDVTSRGENEIGVLSIRVRFNSWDDAKKVHDTLLNRRFSFICNSIFWLRIPPQALYIITIPSGQYRAQETLWSELQGNTKDCKACNIIIRELNGGNYRIQVSGMIKAAVGALKVRVESLAAGEKIDRWHDHLAYPQAELMQKITEVGAFLRSDSQKRTLKLYGLPEAVEKAKAVVMEELERLASLEFTVTLRRSSVGYFVRTGLAAMKEIFGEDNVALDIRSAVIMVRGGEEVRLHLNNHITESLKSVNVNVAAGSHTCPICYDDVLTPFQLVCEHVYCTGCIRHFLTSASEAGTFPLVCMGNESTCGTPISIPVIQKFLPPTAFDHLLEAVFTTHVDKRPQEFRYCKTPDCTQIYRRSEAVSILRCPSCFSETCSSCGEDSHERLSCEDARIHNNPAEQERMSEAWLLQQRGIKKCPTCSRLLEKTEGCNHMSCPCGAHICWRCMGVFDADKIYDHMSTAHGGIFGDEPAPAPARPQTALLHQNPDAFRGIDYLEQVRLLNEVEARWVAQEQYDHERREQDRNAAHHAEAMERWRREQADRERELRLEREARWRRQQAEQQRREQEEADRLYREQVNRWRTDENDRSRQGTPGRQTHWQQQPPQPIRQDQGSWCVVM
ncbi:uncharacterized protein BT62DRAFT_965815 [Guyanagaster necrorhizus]|uniref:Uncharacterized protein n=1 Tax=Guyanagaster necrorhizus TaxID=856835 RepID=A0A9P8AU91_9AGAR|nr:uncharacterized protein BT62DRAFT_965815 [Guyanagaster necrorhizus MCA 3950]KAG7448025.1 hypothetical protein BT62DRAFT_965815 [Guyanagaster necrorhizus MCA 3950]